MSRVLFASAPYAVGGAERVICTLTREFTRRGWETELVFPEKARETGVLAWCGRQGVEAQATPRLFAHDGGTYTHHDFLATVRLIREKRPDVVSLHYGDNFLSFKDALAIRCAGCRYLVMSVHNTSPWVASSAESRHKRRMTRLAAFFCRAVVANSRATEQVLHEAGLPTRKVKRIWCGVPPPPSPLPDRAAVRETLAIAPNAYVVGAVARLVEVKGIQYLLRAVAEYRAANRAANREIMLLIGGDGAYRPALEKEARERLPPSSVRFLGAVECLQDFYPACDVLALPSLKEGFGMVFAEAAFYGVPSIASRVGGVPDAVLDGVTGILTPPADVPALTAALAKLDADASLRRRMGEAARERAHAEFLDTRMADRYEALFLR